MTDEEIENLSMLSTVADAATCLTFSTLVTKCNKPASVCTTDTSLISSQYRINQKGSIEHTFVGIKYYILHVYYILMTA